MAFSLPAKETKNFCAFCVTKNNPRDPQEKILNKMEKLYYSISEVAAITKIPAPTLRFWETQFPQLKPKRTNGQTRQYTKNDIEIIHTINNLTQNQNLTIEGARQHLKNNAPDEINRQKVIERLKNIRAELVAIRRHLNSFEALDSETIVDPQE